MGKVSTFAWRPSSSSSQRQQSDKDKEREKEKEQKPREPLVTASPLAVIAEEEEQRLAEEVRRSEDAAEQARVAAAEALGRVDLPTGVVTGALGALAMLWILLRSRKAAS